jgi:hypothetical protein
MNGSVALFRNWRFARWGPSPRVVASPWQDLQYCT